MRAVGHTSSAASPVAPASTSASSGPASAGTLQHSTLSAGLGSLGWTALGENVGYSSPTSNTLLTIHNKFVGSAPHYAILVDSRWTHMGVGVARDSSGRIWVAEVFARL